MTQKLITVSECDACGREVRDPDYTRSITLAILTNDGEPINEATGVQFDLCDDCFASPDANMLRMDSVNNYTSGVLRFEPSGEQEERKLVATVQNGVVTPVDDTEPTEASTQSSVDSDEVSCPFCTWGPKAPQSVASHMRHSHSTRRNYESKMAEMFPTGKFAQAQRERAAGKKQKPVSYLHEVAQ